MKMKAQEQMIQKLQGELQAASGVLKSRQDVEEIRQHGAITREMIKERSDQQEREITRAQKAHDTETYALTAQNVAEINGLVKLLTSKTEHGQRLREMLLEFEHNVEMQDRQLDAKANQQEPTETVQ